MYVCVYLYFNFSWCFLCILVSWPLKDTWRCFSSILLFRLHWGTGPSLFCSVKTGIFCSDPLKSIIKGLLRKSNFNIFEEKKIIQYLLFLGNHYVLKAVASLLNKSQAMNKKIVLYFQTYKIALINIDS